MNEVYLIRHGEKDDQGVLTANGEKAASELSVYMPLFKGVYSSYSSRAKLTAKLLANVDPVIDDRADYFMSTQRKSTDINLIAKQRRLSFLEAAQEYNDEEVNEGIKNQAYKLNEMIDSILANKGNDIYLIVSHDLSISPAMALRGIPLESIGYLCGYIIRSDGSISHCSPPSTSN